MKFLYVAAVILGVLYSVEAQSCHLREMDLCLAGVLVYARNPADSIPVDDAGIDKQCVQLRETVGCALNFTRKCMTPLQRTIVEMFTRNPQKLLNDYCTAGTELRNNFLKHAKCLREVAAAPDSRRCIQDVQATLDTVSDVPENPYGLACCSYTRFRKCAEAAVESKCGKEAIEFGNFVFQAAVGNIIDRGCSCMDPNSDECNQVLPPPGTKPQGTRSQSPIARLVAVLVGSRR